MANETEQCMKCPKCGDSGGTITLSRGATMTMGGDVSITCCICGSQLVIHDVEQNKTETFVEWGGSLRGFNSKGEIINCAEDLNKREREKKDARMDHPDNTSFSS